MNGLVFDHMVCLQQPLAIFQPGKNESDNQDFAQFLVIINFNHILEAEAHVCVSQRCVEAFLLAEILWLFVCLRWLMYVFTDEPKLNFIRLNFSICSASVKAEQYLFS